MLIKTFRIFSGSKLTHPKNIHVQQCLKPIESTLQICLIAEFQVPTASTRLKKRRERILELPKPSRESTNLKKKRNSTRLPNSHQDIQKAQIPE